MRDLIALPLLAISVLLDAIQDWIGGHDAPPAHFTTEAELAEWRKERTGSF
jgi:hypothetical protein